MNSTERCNCDDSIALRAEIEKRDTQPAPPSEVSEYATVREVDWTTNMVTLRLKLPIALEELPNVDDEVELRWLAREAAAE